MMLRQGDQRPAKKDGKVDPALSSVLKNYRTSKAAGACCDLSIMIYEQCGRRSPNRGRDPKTDRSLSLRDRSTLIGLS
jgi:hypothetical protein